MNPFVMRRLRTLKKPRIASRSHDYTKWVTRIFGELSIPIGYDLKINPEYADILDPYSKTRYPLNRLGNFARVTRRYMLNWFNMGDLINKLDRNVQGFRSLSYHNRCEVTLDSLCRTGTESYTSEWNDDRTQLQLEDMIEDTTGITTYANRLLAEIFEQVLRQDIQRGKDVKDITILDLGPGFVGNTIIPALKKFDKLANEGIIRSDWSQHVRVVLYDVHDTALKVAKSRLKWELDDTLPHGYQEILTKNTGVSPIRHVSTIKGNFQDLQRYSQDLAFQNKIDYVLSGAAIMHNTDLTPFFRVLKRFMKADAALLCWDWDGGPTWAAPNLVLGKEKKTVFHEILPNGNRKVFLELPDNQHPLEGLSPSIPRSKEIRSMEGRVIETTYHMSERAAEIVLANFKTWLGLQGYVATHPFTKEVRERGFERKTIREYIEHKFVQGILGENREESTPGFNYVRDLLRPLEEALNLRELGPITEPTAYNMIEGYGTNYVNHMEDSGFKEARNFYFQDVKCLFGRSIEHRYRLAPSMKDAEQLLKFTVGRT